MSKLLKRRWPVALGTGMSRRDRQGCEYEAYVPDPLVGRALRLDGAVAADAADAEALIRELDARAIALSNTEALARLLLRAESVASSHIEGLAIGGRRLLRAEAARALGGTSGDLTADEVLGNIDAMTWSIDTMSGQTDASIEGIHEMHRRLLMGTRLAPYAGLLRTEQNWIGGSSFNPCSAAFVPPPPELVKELLTDLCGFINDTSMPAVVQAAVAHAQFETIHPFVDGNGRIGRALVHVVLRRRGVGPHTVPPISLVLAGWSKSYVEGLTLTHYRGRPDSVVAREGLNRWIGFFATACRRAAEDAVAFEERVTRIRSRWRSQLGQVRSNSAAALLVDALPGAPILTVRAAATLIGRTFQATNQAVQRLEAAGVVRQISVGRRNRAYEASAIVDAFNDLEKQLGTVSLGG